MGSTPITRSTSEQILLTPFPGGPVWGRLKTAYRSIAPPFRNGARASRLFACKRAHDGFVALPPRFGSAPAARGFKLTSQIAGNIFLLWLDIKMNQLRLSGYEANATAANCFGTKPMNTAALTDIQLHEETHVSVIPQDRKQPPKLWQRELYYLSRFLGF